MRKVSIICDRCGKETTDASEYRISRANLPQDTFDWCLDCIRSFEVWRRGIAMGTAMDIER
jgi:hypothetical protein